MDQNQTQPENENPPFLKRSKSCSSMDDNKFQLIYHQGFWRTSQLSPNVITTFQNHFQARDTDILIASIPKSGTTWLKALLFAIVSRAKSTNNTNQSGSSHPLLTHNPHELVHRLENGVYSDGFIATTYPQQQHLDEMPSPRLFQTHFPYSALAESIKSSACKILYVSRNPLDALVSQWHFYPNTFKKLFGDNYKPPCIEDYFEDFCQGTIPYGPFFDHVLGYWKMSLECPEKVLFLKYEDLKDDIAFHLKRLADFVGFPFSIEEENRGVIDEIIQLCSFKNLKELEVNKSGVIYKTFENKSLFRKGEVGDWINYFTPTMVERMSRLMEEKFKDTRLSFKLFPGSLINE